ncbi:MAG: type II secretion system protein [bacterium]
MKNNLKHLVINTFSKGFTLIELLVVIAILGILLSIISVNLVTAQKQARDARRLQDLESIQTSFESYFAETGTYPTLSPDTRTEAFEGGVIPSDPKNIGDFQYDWEQTETDAYCICAALETRTGNSSAVSTSSTCNTWDTTGTFFCIQSKQ